MNQEMNSTSRLPDAERWVRLHCHDWSPYRVIGKRVLYKKAKNGAWRFMARNSDGVLENMQDAWRDCETWEYCEEDSKP